MMRPANDRTDYRRVTSILAGLMSLLPTPLLIFVSSANKLYLRNQAQLSYQPQVLLPFLELFAITVAVGAPLYFLSRHVLFRYALWSYYLVGPFYLAYRFLYGTATEYPRLSWLTHTDAGSWVFLAAFTVTLFGLARVVKPGAVVTPLAAFGVLLLLAEAWGFRDAFRQAEIEAAPEQSTVSAVAPASALPNIYHIVLDGFQTDMFDQLVFSEIDQSLDGFVYFPNNMAIYHLTSASLASMFGGKRYGYDEPRSEYMEESINGKTSLLYRLNELGYFTTASLPALQDTRIEIADRVVQQTDHTRSTLIEMNTASFRRLWVYSQVPRGLRSWLWSEEALLDSGSSDLKRMEQGRFLPYSGPVVSSLSFSRLMEEEQELPASGRYAFIHLLMPHPPYVLRQDCSYDEAGARTDVRQQTTCTIRLLQEFLQELHRLDRFDGSLILVHGDHGGEYRLKDNALVEARSRSLRALLLVKPVGNSKGDGFQISNVPASLLDIAPTILDCVGAAPGEHMEGKSLSEQARCAPLTEAAAGTVTPLD